MGVRYSNSFTFGNLMQIGGLGIQVILLLGGVLGVWVALSSKLSVMEVRMQAVGDLGVQVARTASSEALNTQAILALTTTLKDITDTNRTVAKDIGDIKVDIATLKARANN